jgi:predicted metal-binding membrane protein
MTSSRAERASHRALLAVTVLVFMTSALVTYRWSASMSAMGGMSMPGGWTMSMTWMRMPDQTWPGVAGSFLAMWVVMMTAMMLPSLFPALVRYRRELIDGGRRWSLLTATVGIAYLLVWALFGALAFLIGVASSTVVMRHPEVSRFVPLATGLVIMGAGVLQLSPWKARRLRACRAGSGALPATFGTAWRFGRRFGLQCSRSSASLMIVLLTAGVMDLRAMIIVGAAITAERLAPDGLFVSRFVGAVVIGGGLLLMALAIGRV